MDQAVAYDWLTFLTEWNNALLTSADAADLFRPEVIETGWVGFPGATDEQIDAAEWRLGVYLPPSYREFLKVSNGWPLMGNPFTGGLLPVDEIERFPVRNQTWLDAIKSLPLNPDVDVVYPVSNEAFEAAIEICETRQGTLLLNPTVLDADGEMEAWFFEAEMGVERHGSFWALMQAEYRLFNYLEEHR
jgi:hypothetical protein